MAVMEFAVWIRAVDRRVIDAEPALIGAMRKRWDEPDQIDRDDDSNEASWRNQGRFVSVYNMGESVRVVGYQASPDPRPLGVDAEAWIVHLRQFDLGEFFVELSEMGADRAADAVAAYLARSEPKAALSNKGS